jgi:hypothetical protein
MPYASRLTFCRASACFRAFFPALVLLGVLVTAPRSHAQDDASPPPTAPDEPTAPPQQPLPGSDNPHRTPPSTGDAVLVVYGAGDEFEATYVSRTPTAVIVEVGGVQTTIEIDSLDDLITLPPADERLRSLRTLVDDSDPLQLLELARWARTRGLLDQALELAREAQALAPSDANALIIERELERLIELRRRQNQEEAAPSPELLEARERRRTRAALRIHPFPLLTQEQADLMKVYELDLRDPPRVVVPRDVRQELLSRYAEDRLVPNSEEGRKAFLRQADRDVLEVMFRLRARELYPRVRVAGLPTSMKHFRDNVNAGWLTSNCGSTDCHGGRDGGDFLIYNRNPGHERAVATNLYILETYRTSEGLPLLDYQEPEFSVLLQMGLPRTEAIWPHPPVRGWRPVFKDQQDRHFRPAVRWLESVYQPRPGYDFEYEMPAEHIRRLAREARERERQEREEDAGPPPSQEARRDGDAAGTNPG